MLDEREELGAPYYSFDGVCRSGTLGCPRRVCLFGGRQDDSAMLLMEGIS